MREVGATALRYLDEDSLLIGAVLTLLVLVVLIVAGLTFRKRRAAEQAAHEARLRAMAQTYLSAARKKKAAEEAAKASTAGGQVGVTPLVPPSSTATRDERECPFCAEPILKKAKVCKHCQRDVEPLAGW